MENNAAPSRRERKKEETRRRIQQAAWRLFDEHGFDATTVKEIADAADVAERTFFRHFPSKEAVVFSDQERNLAGLRDALAGRPSGEAPIESVRAVTLALARDVEGDVERLGRRLRLGSESQSLAAYGRNVVLRGWEDTIATWAAGRYGYDAARDPEPMFLACLASGALIAASSAWAPNGDRPFVALVDDAFRVVLGPGD